MTGYKVAIGHDNQAGLTLLDPQPASDGIRPARVLTPASGLAFDDGGYFAILKYSALNESQWLSLLARFGLEYARSSEITLRALADDRLFSLYNGVVVKPQPRWRFGFASDVDFVVGYIQSL